jgi:hypothetical protein
MEGSVLGWVEDKIHACSLYSNLPPLYLEVLNFRLVGSYAKSIDQSVCLPKKELKNCFCSVHNRQLRKSYKQSTASKAISLPFQVFMFT